MAKLYTKKQVEKMLKKQERLLKLRILRAVKRTLFAK